LTNSALFIAVLAVDIAAVQSDNYQKRRPCVVTIR